MTHIVSLNIFKSAYEGCIGTLIKKSQILNTFEMCGKSLVLISDNFLLFILLLIFLHSSAHGTHALADLFKLTSDINFFFTFNVTSNQQLSLPLRRQLALLHN